MLNMITVLSATTGLWELLGSVIRQAGREDASGARRYYVGLLECKEYDKVCADSKIDRTCAEGLRDELVKAWGEPEEQ